MKHFLTGVIALGAALIAGSSANAGTTECTEITSAPFTITVQGVYCLKQDLALNLAAGKAITIETNNVTIDFNGFKLGNLAAGATTQAVGVYALNRKNITLRNGNIRGFYRGIYLEQDTADASSGHLIEDNRLDGNTRFGMEIAGSNITIRNNQVINTDSTPPAAASASSGLSYANSNSGYSPQAGTGGTAAGIIMTGVTNGIVEGNLISGTTSRSGTYGIFLVSGSGNLRVTNNTVVDTISTGYVAYGIFVWGSSQRVSIHDNVLIDGQANYFAYGIQKLSSSDLSCFNNIIMNFTNGQTYGCTDEAGTLPSP